MAATAASKLSEWTSTPNSAFNLALGVLAASTAGLKLYGRSVGGKDGGDAQVSFDVVSREFYTSANHVCVCTMVALNPLILELLLSMLHGYQAKDPKVKSLQIRFLAVFWLLRMADWLQVRNNKIATHLYTITCKDLIHSSINLPITIQGTILLPSLCIQILRWSHRRHGLGIPSLPYGICFHGTLWSHRRKTL